MKGDILIIGDHHRRAAKGILDLTLSGIRSKQGKFFISIAGESGSGKSELAYALEGLLEKMKIPAYIIQQDDYFVFPPKTNERMRVIDINRVGPAEVRLDLLDENIRAVQEGHSKIEKPLVIFAEDRITSEIIDLDPFRVIIIDGTYTTLLEQIDCRVFIDRDRNDTRADRLKRNRERQNDYLENILEIEHNIISRQKALAHIIVNKDFVATKSE
jgi:uridine kinase